MSGSVPARFRKALVGLSLACCGGEAAAADLALRGSVVPEAYVPAEPLYDWNGLHIGIEGGWIRGGKQTLLTTGTNPQEQNLIDFGNIGVVGFSKSGTFIGGGIGYDVQGWASPGLVVGLAADVLYTDLVRRQTTGFPYGPNDVEVIASQQLNWIGTARGRVGYAFDNVLVYATGGLAFGEVDLKGRVNLTNASYSGIYDSGRYRGIETGYVYGGGVELGLPAGLTPWANRLSFKVEYLRYDLGTRTVQLHGQGPVFGPGGTQPVGHTGDTIYPTRGQILKAGLNVKLY